MSEGDSQGLGQSPGGGGFFTTLPGLITAAATLLTVIGGIFGLTSGSGGSSGGSSGESTNNKSVTFTIRDTLGPDQLDESVDVKIEGRSVGELVVDSNNRTDQLNPSVDEGEGKYEYSLASASLLRDPSGRPVEVRGSGQGTINVKQGKTFEVCGNITGNTMQVSLAESC